MKTCSKCYKSKETSEFSTDNSRSDNLYYRCKHCVSGEKKMSRFGITNEQYDHILSEQEGSCAICGILEGDYSQKYKTFHIDHCHKTNKVRALLCGNCNRGIGMLQDDPEITQRATDYLLYHNERLA